MTTATTTMIPTFAIEETLLHKNDDDVDPCQCMDVAGETIGESPRNHHHHHYRHHGGDYGEGRYRSLVIDSGAIIKGSSLFTFPSSSSSSSSSFHHAGLLQCADNYYTVPGVLREIRDVESRRRFDEFKSRLSSLRDGAALMIRIPSDVAMRAVSDFARKTGDYARLSDVDLQVLGLLYDLEGEANSGSGGDNGGAGPGGVGRHVRRVPRGWHARKNAVTREGGGSSGAKDGTSVTGNTASSGNHVVNDEVDDVPPSYDAGPPPSPHGDANGVVDASLVDYDDSDEEDSDEDDVVNDNEENYREDDGRVVVSATNTEMIHDDARGGAKTMKSWALIVDPVGASTIPLVDYSIGTRTTTTTTTTTTGGGDEGGRVGKGDERSFMAKAEAECGQFDDASSEEGRDYDIVQKDGEARVTGESNPRFDDNDDDDNDNDASSSSYSSSKAGEDEALEIANANSDDELPSDEECDVYVLEPHEAAYYKRLRDEKAMKDRARKRTEGGVSPRGGREEEEKPKQEKEDEGDRVGPIDGGRRGATTSKDDWRKEEEERKRMALRPMVNGRPVVDASYNSFRRYRDVMSAGGSAAAAKIAKGRDVEEGRKGDGSSFSGEIKVDALVASGAGVDANEDERSTNNDIYKSRILGASAALLAQSDSAGCFPSEMTAEDDDGEGWVTSIRDIRAMKAAGSLDPNVRPPSSSFPSHIDDRCRSNAGGARDGRRIIGPPIHMRAACATTDFAMQNVILQMNLELVTVDGARVHRLKTWVTRCGACFTVYAGEEREKAGGRLFCYRCGSNMMQRIACSVDRGTGRLKLHMKKNYRVNTRGTKFSLPKPGKCNKYEGDLLLAEDQLLYGAWNQKVRMGKSKSSGQSIFGSDLASDLGCIADLTKRDDIKVGFGRRNPNSTKFGRERRGKKKKNVTEKACGLRRY